MSYRTFDTEIRVRPDDIDMNNHVHNSKYLDYVLFARYDQMGRCYGMPMEEFLQHGWTWFQKASFIEYKRQLGVSERAVVRTWLDSFDNADVRVGFQVLRENGKIAAEGYFISTMIDMKTGRAEKIPQWVIDRYTRFVE